MSQPFTFLQNLSELTPTIQPDSIVSKSVANSDSLKAILFGFAAGQELSEHTAAMPAILHFLQGTAVLTLGADTMNVTEGSWVEMEPNLPHSIVAETDVVMLLIMLKNRQ